MSPRPRACRTIEELHPGERFALPYRITIDDVKRFAELSGDYNPIHLDPEYAKRTVFKERISHGLLSASKFSGIFGMALPGLGALWQSQTLRFIGPIYIDRMYKAIVEVKEISRRTAVFHTWVEDSRGKHLIEGEGVVYPISARAKQSITNAEMERLLDRCPSAD